MTDKERREDDVLKNCIQEAYGISDEQLLAELDEIEATLSDDEFVGVEDRIYEKLMERVEEETGSESTIMPDVTHDAMKATKVPEKNVVRIRKKKLIMVAILAAAFAGVLGVSTVGNNNYFLKRDIKREEVILDSGDNLQKVGSLEEAYKKVKEELDFPVLKMSYIPLELIFDQLSIINNKATFTFSYNNKKIYLIQEKESKEISTGINLDRGERGEIIYNKWISQDVLIEENTLTDGSIEYSALIYIDEMKYRFIGILPEEELRKIVNNFNF